MSTEQSRIVTKEPVSTEDLDRVISPTGLKYSRRMSKKATNIVPRHVWHDRHGSVVLVKDEPLELDYIKIDLPDPRNIEALLRRSFPCYQWDDTVNLIRSSSWRERALAFRILSELKYVEFDQELFEILTSSILEGTLDCSRALFAARRLSWHQLRPVVEQATERHSESHIGDLAWDMLHGSDWDR